MRVALAGTYPPLRSGITDYTVELARALVAAGHDVRLYGDPAALPVAIEGVGAVAPADDLVRAPSRADVVLVQAGGHPGHAYLLDLVPRVPAVVDLHDWSLYDPVASRFVGRPGAFVVELLRSEGLGGVVRAVRRRPPGQPYAGPVARARHALTLDPSRRERFPLHGRILRGARGVVVHSPYLAGRVRARFPRLRVADVPHGVRVDHEAGSRAGARERLGLAARGVPADAFVVLSFGLLQRHKRIPEALAAFAEIARGDGTSRYVLLGPRCPSYDLDRDVDRLGLGGRVLVVDDFPPVGEVACWIGAADVGVNLRGPSYGGMSGALLKMLAGGLPVIATPVPELAHLPADVVRFVAADAAEHEGLVGALVAFRADPESRERAGVAGARWIRAAGYGWPDVAARYVDLLERWSGRPAAGGRR